jgi:hypothetical protein
MKMIEIDGRRETVWRCRALVSWRTAGVFPFSGGDWAEALRTDASAPQELPRDHQLEILLTEEVLLCSTDGPVEATAVAFMDTVAGTPTVVGAIDTVKGTIRMKSGVVVAARFYRREHLAGEAQVVREERMIMMLSHAKDAKITKVGWTQASKRMR